MKTIISPFHLRHSGGAGLVTVLLAMMLASTATAQPSAGGDAKGNSGALRKDVIQQSVNDSAALFMTGNVVSAEQKLLSVNLSVIDTPDWHLESARRLVDLALLFQVNKDPKDAQVVVQKALDQLTSADVKIGGKDHKAKAQLLTQLGFVYDALLFNIPAALDCYQQALQLDPKAPRAAAEVARLGHAVAALENKRKHNR